jgi:hypothetical protein
MWPGYLHLMGAAPRFSRNLSLLVDARGERLTPSHAVKKGRRYQPRPTWVGEARRLAEMLQRRAAER